MMITLQNTCNQSTGMTLKSNACHFNTPSHSHSDFSNGEHLHHLSFLEVRHHIFYQGAQQPCRLNTKFSNFRQLCISSGHFRFYHLAQFLVCYLHSLICRAYPTALPLATHYVAFIHVICSSLLHLLIQSNPNNMLFISYLRV